MRRRILRFARSLQFQLFLWAVLPVSFVIIALAFTGVYAHQRAMGDFVADRDLSLARLAARFIDDGLAHGVVSPDGQGLSNWMPPIFENQPHTASLVVVNGAGEILAWSGAGPQPDEETLRGIAPALRRDEGSVLISSDSVGPVLVAFAPVTGTEWEVLVHEPVNDVIGPILRLSNLAPIVAVGAAVVSLLILTFGWRTVIRPLQTLVEAAVRDYLTAITGGQEAERARLARELHDGPVQDLIALGRAAEMAQRLLARDEIAEARSILADLGRAERGTLEELRRLIGALRPSYLEDLGFIPALEMLVRQADERTSAQVSLEGEGAGRRHAAAVELAAYRIGQEALNNAVQHAEADNIMVRVRATSEGLVLSVIDDGVGFALPSRPDVLTQAGHFGLMGMRERATLLGGSFHIDTGPGEGTRVTVQLPAQAGKTDLSGEGQRLSESPPLPTAQAVLLKQLPAK